MYEKVDPQLAHGRIESTWGEVTSHFTVGSVPKRQFHVIVKTQCRESGELLATQHDSDHPGWQTLHPLYRELASLQLVPNPLHSRFTGRYCHLFESWFGRQGNCADQVPSISQPAQN